MKNLDIDAVQAFVLVAKLKSFTRAADLMDAAQAAISLKIKKLETQLGKKLIERTPRSVRASLDGERFLPAAQALLAAHQQAMAAFGGGTRPLVLGISHHLTGADLPRLLRRLHETDPDTVVEVRVAPSRATLDAFEQGKIDVALVLRHDSRRLDGETIAKEPFVWVAAADYRHASGTPLRPATQAAPCSVRGMALSALDAAGIAWPEVFVGGGVNTIGAAVLAGLAVAAMSRPVATADVIEIGPGIGLPPLPARDVVLYCNLTDSRSRQWLCRMVASFRPSAVAVP